jgi:hypothetical protein
VSSLPAKTVTTSPRREKPTVSAAKVPRKKAMALVRANDDDPRFVALMKAFRSDAKLAPVVDAFEANKNGRKFGSNGLKVNGKLFALFTQGTIVVKLPKERVAALVEARVGTPFDPGRGRLMKEWLTVTSTKASWIDLATEAHAFVSQGSHA